MIDTTMLYILTLVWMTLTFIQGFSFQRSHRLQCPFFANLGFDFVEIQSVATTGWFVGAHATFISTGDTQGRELC